MIDDVETENARACKAIEHWKTEAKQASLRVTRAVASIDTLEKVVREMHRAALEHDAGR